jgi:hypothetical protein
LTWDPTLGIQSCFFKWAQSFAMYFPPLPQSY